MKTTKNTDSLSYTDSKKRIIAEKKSKLSGTTIKTGVIASEGIYPVGNLLNGTGIITRFLLSIALKSSKLPITGKAPASEIRKAFTLISEALKIGVKKINGKDKKVVIGGNNPLGIAIFSELKRTGKSYGNYNTLRNRFLGDISEGLTLGASFSDSDNSEAKNIFAKIN